MSIIDFKMVKVFKFDQQFNPVNSLFKSWPFLWAFPHFWVSIHILLVTEKIFDFENWYTFDFDFDTLSYREFDWGPR